MSSRRTLIVVAVGLLLLLPLGTTESHANTEFIEPYGGWAWNDENTAPENGYIYGLTFGVENAAGGATITLDINNQGGTEMESLYASVLLNFVSKDARMRRKFIRNRFSSWISVGVGGMRFRRETRDRSLRLLIEGGLGLQYRFTRNFGIRFDALAIFLPAGNNLVGEGRFGLGFYWGQGR